MQKYARALREIEEPSFEVLQPTVATEFMQYSQWTGSPSWMTAGF